MAELKFVLKSVVITAVLMFALQFEVTQGVRAETLVSDYLRNGVVSVWVRESVKGAHLFVMNSGTDLAPKLNMKHWLPKWESQPEKPRNISSDIPADFPEDEIGTDVSQGASAL